MGAQCSRKIDSHLLSRSPEIKVAELTAGGIGGGGGGGRAGVDDSGAVEAGLWHGFAFFPENSVVAGPRLTAALAEYVHCC